MGLMDAYREDPDPIDRANLGSTVEQPVRQMHQFLERSDTATAPELRETFRRNIGEGLYYRVIVPNLRDRIEDVVVAGGGITVDDDVRLTGDELRETVVQDLVSPTWDYSTSGGFENPLDYIAKVSVVTYERLARDDQPPVTELELEDRAAAWPAINLPRSDYAHVREDVLPELPGFADRGELELRIVDDDRREAAAGEGEDVDEGQATPSD